MDIDSTKTTTTFSSHKARHLKKCIVIVAVCSFALTGLALAVYLSITLDHANQPAISNPLLPSPVAINVGDSFTCVGSANKSFVPVRLVPFASGLLYPWAMVFLPNGHVLVTDRFGDAIKLFDTNGIKITDVSGFPSDIPIYGGMYDIALDPLFATNRLLYLTYVEPDADAGSDLRGTAVLRARLSEDDRSLQQVVVIFRAVPKLPDNDWFGARILPHRDTDLYDGTLLFVTNGAPFQPISPLRLDSHLGKTMRITDMGAAAPGNPHPSEFRGSFGGVENALPEIWSIGHRNPQGAALHPVTQELWSVEHGPQGGDELNICRHGQNYGWPNVSYGCPYGAPLNDSTCRIGGSRGVHKPPFVAPDVYWYPRGIGVGNLAFHDMKSRPWSHLFSISPRAIREWDGQIFVGGMAGTVLYRLVPEGTDGRFSGYERILTGDHQIRDIKMGPDGLLYLVSRYPAQILRIERVD